MALQKTLAIVVLLLLTGGAGTPPTSAEPPVDSLETHLLMDAADGRLDHHTLFDAALIAGGVSDRASLARFQQRYANYISRLGRPAARSTSDNPLPAAARLLRWMHEEILTEYRPECSQLSATLTEGTFNCLSSTVLYHSLAQELGLPTRLVARPGHVLVELHLPAETWEIETTSPVFGATTSPALSETVTSCTPCRPLTEVQMVALVYYNRGFEALTRRQFADAVAANLAAMHLDRRCEAAEANLVAAINNWAVELGRQRRFQEAADLMAAGRRLAPDQQSFIVNARYLRQARSSPAAP